MQNVRNLVKTKNSRSKGLRSSLENEWKSFAGALESLNPSQN